MRTGGRVHHPPLLEARSTTICRRPVDVGRRHARILRPQDRRRADARQNPSKENTTPAFDAESAYEILKKRVEETAAAEAEAEQVGGGLMGLGSAASSAASKSSKQGT
jgi:hypothetical protein